VIIAFDPPAVVRHPPRPLTTARGGSIALLILVGRECGQRLIGSQPEDDRFVYLFNTRPSAAGCR
jgi:hypothetical protein